MTTLKQILALEAARQEGYRMGLEDAARLARDAANLVSAQLPEQSCAVRLAIEQTGAGIASCIAAVAETARRTEERK